jgi:flavin-dependent dehydrogenase
LNRFIKDLTSATLDDLPRLETVGVGHEFNIPGEGAIFDATNMTEYVRFGNGHGPDFIRADRSKLRAWLQTNINVHWDKRFTHFEEHADGVTAYFDDGTSYRGSILVGADGVNSRVRDQLLSNSNLRPEPVPLGIVVGEVEATEEQFKRWKKLANTFFIGYAGIRRMFVGLKSVAADEKGARYYWFFFW